MKHPLRLLVCCSAAVLLLAMTANGQTTFSYSDTFDTATLMATPAGWSSVNNHPVPVPPNIDAIVIDADPATWATPCDANTFTPAGCSLLGAGAVQTYGSPRLNLIHPGLSPGDGNGWAAVAWYAGEGPGQTGTYPLNLQTDSLRIEFDVWVRSGDARCGTTPADGGVFAVLPVTDLATDITRLGAAGGGLGWGGLYGFAVEFDNYNNGAGTEVQPGKPDLGSDQANHVGLDVAVKWDGGKSLVTHQDPPLSLPDGFLPRFVEAGNGNVPLHFTVYYNDPVKGGEGYVQVYLRVAPYATLPAGFGLETGDPDGALILTACVGPWPTAGAIFGFTGSIGGCNEVFQVDNIVASTAALTNPQGACNPGVTFDPGPVLNAVDAASNLGPCDGATEQGWDVTTYHTLGNTDTPSVKNQIAYFASRGLTIGSAHAVPDLNYEDTGCGGSFGSNRKFPGLPSNDDHNNFGVVAKGFICFPQDDPNDPNDNYPRDYAVAVESDDGFELKIGYVAGSDDPTKLIGEFNGGRGCGGPTNFRIQVPTPGVYTIQMLWYEGGGGAGIEFRRRIPNDSLLAAGIVALMGPPSVTYPDQPVVYSRFNGQPAPDLISAWTPMTLPVVQLSPTQKLGDASVATGNPVFKVKATAGPYDNIEERNWEDSNDMKALGWLDTTTGFAAGATSATVNFREPGQGDGPVPGGSNFPGLGSARDRFAFRGEGYIVFPAAGTYLLGVDSDDGAWLRIGKQVIYSSGCCPNTRFELNVTDPGTYPVRVELIEYTGDARIDFYQYAPDAYPVSVNDPASTLKVFDSATTGEYDWPGTYWNISASRKVAEVGQGGTPGWNATLAKAPVGIDLDANIGLTEVILHNNFAGWPGDPAVLGYDTPDAVNYTDIGFVDPDPNQTGEEGEGWFTRNAGDFQAPDWPDRSVLVFDPTSAFLNPAGENEQFTIGAVGYIEFSAAGNYQFNMNGDDGMQVWIGGEIVSIFPYNTGPQDFSPGFVHISAPGIYEIRVISFERGGGYSMEFFQFLPDNTRALVNSPQATVKVYRTLADATVAAYDPVFLPASASAAAIDRGGESGARIQMVNGDFAAPRTGNGDGGMGHDKLYLIPQATEMLDAALGVTPSLRQFGIQVADTVRPTIAFGSTGEFPGPPNEDDFVMRATGYLALKKGGHILNVASDDGFEMRMNGNVVGRSQHLKGTNDKPFAVIAEEDGLYPFTLDYLERGGGNACTLYEFVLSAGAYVVVNTGDAMKMYANVNPCPIPFADADVDGDVDQEDFGKFQSCFTLFTGGPLSGTCRCFDRDNNGAGNGSVDAIDYTAFMDCFSGPRVLWVPGGNCLP